MVGVNINDAEYGDFNAANANLSRGDRPHLLHHNQVTGCLSHGPASPCSLSVGSLALRQIFLFPLHFPSWGLPALCRKALVYRCPSGGTKEAGPSSP